MLNSEFVNEIEGKFVFLEKNGFHHEKQFFDPPFFFQNFSNDFRDFFDFCENFVKNLNLP